MSDKIKRYPMTLQDLVISNLQFDQAIIYYSNGRLSYSEFIHAISLNRNRLATETSDLILRTDIVK